MKNGLEWLRLATPVMLGVSLFILTQIWGQLNEVSHRLYLHQTNEELHIPRSEYVDVRMEIRDMRREIVEMIRRVHQTGWRTEGGDRG